MDIEKEITLTFSDHLKLHETTNELKDLIKEYNFKLIDKGLAVKRSNCVKTIQLTSKTSAITFMTMNGHYQKFHLTNSKSKKQFAKCRIYGII